MDIKKIALIPARCGSKGIHLKNLYPINGKPLMWYSINAIKHSNIDNCCVSTDCKEIGDYATAQNIRVINRPAEIAQDHSTTVECVLHAINTLGLHDNDIIITIQATNPMILPTDINLALDKLSIYDSVISVTEYHRILWSVHNETLSPVNHNPCDRKRRQDSPNIVCETGSIYASKVKHILKNQTICGGNNIGYIDIPKNRSFEIDSYDDVKIIEAMMHYDQNNFL